MTKINILPENLSNQIAAGEVVERPASVVKELVENSIDAGSSRIVIEVEQGGRQKIRIFDDGEGMGHDDALLCLERYATSKIKDKDDLFSIGTLGFRGEAIPSIASVSHFSIYTRSRLEESGTFINVKGGKLLDVQETGLAAGTDIRVTHLFYNTPARRKFLKAVNTEMGHISETIACLALGSPDVYFKLVHNGRVVREWPGGKISDRAVEVLGRDFKNNLYPVSNTIDDVRVTGFAGSPDITRSSSGKIYVFVNGRYIKDRAVIYSIYEGYEGRIMKGRYPGCVIFINLPFEKVDVNVHPTKHEVRFADQRMVMACVKRGIAEAVKKEDSKKWKNLDPSRKIEKPVFKPQFRQNISETPVSGNLFSKRERPVLKTEVRGFANTNEEISPKGVEERFEYNPPVVENEKAPIEASETSFSKTTEESGIVNENSFYSNLKIIGQIRNSYIICESFEGMILVDQHAAHERIRYEWLMKSHSDSRGASQQLLMPQVIELGYRESAKLLVMLEEFKRFGLEISHYGGKSFAVQSIPLIFGSFDVRGMIYDLASMITDLPASYEISAAVSDVIALMACHGSIRANQKLELKQITTLFKDLDKCENPSRCPHGRPVWINIDWDFIEKSFKRKL